MMVNGYEIKFTKEELSLLVSYTSHLAINDETEVFTTHEEFKDLQYKVRRMCNQAQGLPEPYRDSD